MAPTVCALHNFCLKRQKSKQLRCLPCWSRENKKIKNIQKATNIIKKELNIKNPLNILDDEFTKNSSEIVKNILEPKIKENK